MKVRISAFVILVSSLVVITSFRSSQFKAAERESYTELFIKNDSVITEDFLGVNGVYHGFAFMEDAHVKVMTDQERQVEFSRVKNMDLKIARTWYRPDWACGNNLYNDFDWESKRMKAFYSWLDKMKELKVDVALQAGWWFTKDTYHNTDGKSEAVPDTVRDPQRYAKWVRESLQELIKVRGYDNIKYLMLFTEPLNYRSGIVPAGFTEPDYYDKVCTEIHNELKRADLRSAVKLVGPNSGSTDTAAYVGWSVNRMNDVIDIYSWHSYNGKQFNTNPPLEYDGWKQIALAGSEKIKKTGKPYWIDEYGANKPDESVRFKPDYGNYLAQCVAAFINSGAQSSLLWILFDQKYAGSGTTNKDSFYNGVHRWGLTRSPQDSIDKAGTPYPSWYAFSMMSKYLGGRNRSKAFKTTQSDSLYVVATQPSGKNISVMIVNGAHTSRKFKVKFSRQPAADLSRYLYDPAHIKSADKNEMLPSDKRFKSDKDEFYDEIPARAVAIYTTMK